MSSTSSSNRWIPFQCPNCFGLFRLRKNQLGQIGRCPTCAELVATAEKMPVLAMAGGEVSQESKEALLERIPVAKEMTPEELAERERAKSKRKRVYATKDGASDWDEQKFGDGSSAIPWKVWGSGVMLLILVSAFGIRLITTRQTEEAVGSDLVFNEEFERLMAQYSVEPKPKAPVEDEVSNLVDRYSEFDLDKVEDALRGFLDAESVDEKKTFVRQKGRVGPLMDDYYSRQEFEREGFDTMDRLKVTFRNNFVLTAVTTSDFLTRGVSLERRVEDGKEVYEVDWESWVAYSEKSPEEMRAEKPTEPFVIRPRVSPGNYYNYSFSDDKAWSCYDLELDEGAFLFLGYVPKGSDLDKTLEVVRKGGRTEPFILRVAYPPRARAKDQVEILEVVAGDGWIFDPPKGKSNE